MFIGEYTHTLDEKKRLAMPSKFRKELGNGAVVTRGLDKCLVVYPMKVWEEMAEKLGNLPASQLEARGLGRIMLAGATSVEFDKLGRALIPDYLKEYATLGKDITIIGLFNRIEIWDASLWKKYREGAEKQMDDYVSKLKDLGI